MRQLYEQLCEVISDLSSLEDNNLAMVKAAERLGDHKAAAALARSHCLFGDALRDLAQVQEFYSNLITIP